MGNRWARPINAAAQTVVAPAQVLPTEVRPAAEAAIAVYLMTMAFEYARDPQSFSFNRYRIDPINGPSGVVWIVLGAGAHQSLGLRVGSTESTLFLAAVAMWQATQRNVRQRTS